jgi:hypothetical protein
MPDEKLAEAAIAAGDVIMIAIAAPFTGKWMRSPA